MNNQSNIYEPNLSNNPYFGGINAGDINCTSIRNTGGYTGTSMSLSSGLTATNIVPLTNASSDIGTSSNKFNNIYLAGSLIGTSKTIAVNSIVPAIFSLNPIEPTTITNTTSQSTLLGAGIGTLTLPANSTQPGTILKISGISFGKIVNTNVINFVLNITNVSHGTNSVAFGITSDNSYLNIGWLHTITIHISSTANIVISWIINFNNGPTAPVTLNGTAGSVWNTTTTNTLDFQAFWGTASTSNSVTQRLFAIEQLF